MKSLVVCFLVSLSISSFASTDNCYDSVSKDYLNSSREARYSNLRAEFDFIKKGEVVEFGRNVSFGPYEEEMLAYHATGSIHSGWFHNVIIVNPFNCEIEVIKMVADE